MHARTVAFTVCCADGRRQCRCRRARTRCPARLQALAAGGFSVIKAEARPGRPRRRNRGAAGNLPKAAGQHPPAPRRQRRMGHGDSAALLSRGSRAAGRITGRTAAYANARRTACAAGNMRIPACHRRKLVAARSRCLFRRTACTRLTLKLAAQGGILPAAAIAQQARAAGVACIVTSGIGGTCGTLAAAHLAASRNPLAKMGPATTEAARSRTGWPPRTGWNKTTGHPTITDGRLQLPTGPGLGFEPLPPMPSSAAPASRPA